MRFVSGLACLLLWFPTVAIASTSVVTTEHVKAELVAHAPEGIAPGKTVWLGLAIEHAPRWHTYWKNPGDSGLPTTLSWTLPAGIDAGDIEWPTPQQLPIGPLTNYGYEGRLLLPVKIKVSKEFSAEAVDVKLRADWLVCEEICIPESGEFALRVPARATTLSHAGLFDAAWARAPISSAQVQATARIERQAIVVEIRDLPLAFHQKALRFFAETAGTIDHAAPIEQRWEGARWVGKVPLSAQRSESPAVMYAVLTAPGQPAGARVRLAIGTWATAAGAPPSHPAPTPAPPTASSGSFLVTLGLALLGGMLLNLMPCVFPVLSLKVLSLAQSGQDRRTLMASGLAYTAGVIVSFLALAGLLMLLRASGELFGWGFQLQSPLFVAALAVLFTAIGLNLAGVFEFAMVLPNGVATWRARHPLAEHAFTGLLAGAIASPCTGPFMGVALGVALTLPAAQALAVFAALGVGMALPYLAVSALPGLASHLPRPGVWMLRLKVFLAFPMFATVVWLLWVLGQQTGIDGAVGVLAFLVALAFVVWAIGTPGFGRKARIGFGATALLTLLMTGTWAWPRLDDLENQSFKATTGADWQPWSSSAVASAQAAGRPVFVDFTAAWCITCQFNKRTTLSSAEVLAGFKRHNVVLLRADWTRRDPAITQELTRLGRSGVPVYALYTSSSVTPALLPEILRIDALQRALGELPLATTDPSGSTISPRSP